MVTIEQFMLFAKKKFNETNPQKPNVVYFAYYSPKIAKFTPVALKNKLAAELCEYKTEIEYRPLKKGRQYKYLVECYNQLKILYNYLMTGREE
jgi:hypothetical protein